MSSPDPASLSPCLAAILAAISSLAAAHAGAQTFYVDDDAPPGGDGSSWDTAFRDLQDALDLIRDIRPPWAEIRVAQGTYTPDRSTLDRAESFSLTSAVTLIGGFAGLGAPNPDELDPKRFVSVLSGDLRRDDAPNFDNRFDNSYHVVDISHADGSAQLNGVTIRGGYADGTWQSETNRGAGIFGAADQWCSVTINNCRLIDNYARDDGAAASLHFGGITIIDSLVATNRTSGYGYAAGISAGRTVWAQRVRFADNAAENWSVSGSALAALGSCYLRDCLFDANDPNRPTLYAAGIVSLHRSTFANNGGEDLGSVYIVTNTMAEIDGCIFHNPPATFPRGEIFIQGAGSSLRVTNSLVRGGRAGIGQFGAEIIWGPGNIDADPRFTDPDGPDNDPATWQDNDFSLTPGSPCIDAGQIEISDPADLDQRQQPRYVSARGDCLRRADMGAIENQDASSAPPIPVLFVNAAANPGGDGLSWSTAYRDLNDALRTPGVREIWIAAGTYTPDMGTRDPRPSFDIQCQVRILGGFNGTETFAEQRDPDANPTILTGDLLGNDDGSPESIADNTQHILRLQLADAVVDGVTIERGYAHSDSGIFDGAGVNAEYSSVQLSRCVIQNCTGRQGAGMHAYESRVSIDDSLFRANTAEGTSVCQGGAIHSWGGDLSIARTNFVDNLAVADHYGAYGAAVSADQLDTLAIIGCTFNHNRSVALAEQGSAGAAAFNVFAEDVAIINCVVMGNEAIATPFGDSAWSAGGVVTGDRVVVANSLFIANRAQGWSAGVGGLYFGAYERAMVANCTVVANESQSETPSQYPGGILCDSYRSDIASIVNCIIWGNESSADTVQRAQLAVNDATLSHNCIQGWDNSLPGESNFSADPLFRSADDLRLSPGSPCIDAGDAALLPADVSDLDHDHDTTEPLPLDAANRPRVVGPALDIGAFETQPTVCAADYNTDAILNSTDFFIFLTDYFAGNPRADFNVDGSITSRDFFDYINAFLAGC